MIQLTFLITIFLGIFWHFVLEKYWWASVGSATSATCLIFLIGLGSHYNFYGDHVLRDVVKVFIISLIFSIIIGAIFVNVREKNYKKKL
ncbi:MAG: hypothetical protein ACI9LO_002148 [Planctomycetota bacterium]|jgi:hypothetical protein